MIETQPIPILDGLANGRIQDLHVNYKATGTANTTAFDVTHKCGPTNATTTTTDTLPTTTDYETHRRGVDGTSVNANTHFAIRLTGQTTSAGGMITAIGVEFDPEDRYDPAGT